MITDDEMETVALWHHAITMQRQLGIDGFSQRLYQILNSQQRAIVDQFERLRAKAEDDLARLCENKP